MNYQWYPGHMTKARRQMQEDLKLIDLMIELVDARVPAASRNPDIDELGKNKARLILLNKSDLADERGNSAPGCDIPGFPDILPHGSPVSFLLPAGSNAIPSPFFDAVPLHEMADKRLPVDR